MSRTVGMEANLVRYLLIAAAALIVVIYLLIRRRTPVMRLGEILPPGVKREKYGLTTEKRNGDRPW
jgi:hypothetical protein